MGFFSEELRIMDRNLVTMMIEEQQIEIEKLLRKNETQQRELEAQQRKNEAQQLEIDEQQREIETLRKRILELECSSSSQPVSF